MIVHTDSTGLLVMQEAAGNVAIVVLSVGSGVGGDRASLALQPARRAAGDLWHRPHAQVWRSQGRLPGRVWSLDDGLQSLEPVEPSRHLDARLAALTEEGWIAETGQIDSSYVKAHRSAGGANVLLAPSASGLCLMIWSSTKTYPVFQHGAVGQDGDPRVLVLIKGPASSAILRRRVPGHRSTVRPSITHPPQTSSGRCTPHQPISLTPLA